MVDKVEAGERWQHVKRGTSYEVLGLGELQMQSDLVDGSSLVIYRGDDERLWAREESEFLDGRFVKVVPTHTQDTRDRVKVLEEALERLSKPYFWTEDGFWADASTPAHRETELHQRLQIARTALGNKETYRG